MGGAIPPLVVWPLWESQVTAVWTIVGRRKKDADGGRQGNYGRPFATVDTTATASATAHCLLGECACSSRWTPRHSPSSFSSLSHTCKLSLSLCLVLPPPPFPLSHSLPSLHPSIPPCSLRSIVPPTSPSSTFRSSAPNQGAPLTDVSISAGDYACSPSRSGVPLACARVD